MKVADLIKNPKGYQQLVDTLQRHCKKNFEIVWDNEYKLFRGDSSRGAKEADAHIWWFESQKRTQPRKSQTENNIGLVWTAGSDAWADVPRRFYSNSCTTNFSSAAQFGHRVYLIIPFDNIKQYAHAPQDFNFFQAEPNNNHRAPDLLNRLGYFYNIQDGARRTLNVDAEDGLESLQKILRKHKAAVTLEVNEYTNIQQIWKFSDLVNDLMEYFSGPPKGELTKLENELQDYVLEYIDDFGMAPASWLKKHITPEKMGVKVYDSFGALEAVPFNEHPEIWFEGQFVAITNHAVNMTEFATMTPFFKRLKEDVLG